MFVDAEMGGIFRRGNHRRKALGINLDRHRLIPTEQANPIAIYLYVAVGHKPFLHFMLSAIKNKAVGQCGFAGFGIKCNTAAQGRKRFQPVNRGKIHRDSGF